MHWASWIVAGLLLSAAVVQLVRARRTRTWRWALGSAVAAFLAAAGLLLLEWVAWPRETGERFTTLVAQSHFEEANRLLAASTQWQVGDDGSVTIHAADGTSMTLAVKDQPLALIRKTPPNYSRRLVGKWDFALMPPPGEGARSLLHFTAERGTVYCQRVEKFEE